VESELPRAETKLSILQHSIEQLAQAGYVYIGMDHFALPTDELAQAQQRRSLYRNFQGYATHAECDLVALGITGISRVGDSYAQNVKTIEEYEARLSRAHIPIERGIKLSADDKLRRDLIMDLICHFSLDIPSLEARHRIRFAEYFAEEIADLEPLQRDGLILVSDRAISVLPVGRLLIRNVCKTFDRYRRIPSPQPLRYSRAI
jgi:oxygen-independent coproporphyrinogen-3 oxidase